MNVSPAIVKFVESFGLFFFSSGNSIIQIFEVITMYGSELFAPVDMQGNVIHDSKKFV